MKFQKSLCAIAAITFIGIIGGVTNDLQASVFTLQAEFEFSGATAPIGIPPWLTATFDDQDTPGSVIMTLIATNLTGGEFVSGWYFNLDPVLAPMDATDLIFSTPVITGSFTTPSISTGIDAFKADGDGKYDILLNFDTSGSISTRFTSGDAISYTITGISSLTADSFNTLSQPAGGHGPFPMAAHVQGIGPDGALSGWVTAPEPATVSFLALGSLLLLRRR